MERQRTDDQEAQQPAAEDEPGGALERHPGARRQVGRVGEDQQVERQPAPQRQPAPGPRRRLRLGLLGSAGEERRQQAGGAQGHDDRVRRPIGVPGEVEGSGQGA